MHVNPGALIKDDQGEFLPLGTEKKLLDIALVLYRVSERLGNTPAVCRARYVHPAVIEKYREGITLSALRRRAERSVRRCQPDYEVEELALLDLLRG